MAIDQDIQAVLNSSESSEWLKTSLACALKLDCVDAANDADVLQDLLTRRCDDALRAAVLQLPR